MPKFLIVTGNTTDFSEGQKLTKVADIANYVRTIADVPEGMTNTDIMNVVAVADGKDDEAIEFAIVDAIDALDTEDDDTGTDDKAEPVADAIAVQNLNGAIDLATKAAANKDLVTALHAVVERNDLTKCAPRDIRDMLAKALGKEGMALLRRPNSTVDGKEGTYKSNNPDIYYVSIRTGKGKRNVKHVWSKEFALSFPEAAGYAKAIQDVKDGLKAKNVTQEKHDKIKGREGARLRAFVGVVQSAIALEWNWNVAQDYAGVKVSWDMERTMKDGKEIGREYAITSEPIRIRGVSEDENETGTVYLTIADFNRLNFDVAKEKGGTLSALLDTLTREAQTPAGETEYKLAEVPSVIARLANTFERDRGAYAGLVALLSVQSGERDHLLLSLASVRTVLVNALSPHLKTIGELRDKDKPDREAAERVG